MKRKSERIANQQNKKSKTDDSDSGSEDSDNDSDIFTFMNEENILEELKKTDKKTYDKFIEIKDVIDNSIPDITTIINEQISVNNKARIVELYEVFRLTEPLTEEWLLLKDLSLIHI